MFVGAFSEKRLEQLLEAFEKDGFNVVKVATYREKLGIAAESKYIFNYDTKKPKKVYYIEGSPYETGYLMGYLAEEEISRMMEYTDKVVFSFIGSKVLEKAKLIQRVLIKLVYELSKPAWKNMPGEIREEVAGLYDGCRNKNPKTKVDIERLIALNCGVDILCSMVYTGNFLKRDIKEIEPEDLAIPLMCNAIAVCGKSAGFGCYFGRDFTFPSAGVFQDTAAPIIYKPAAGIPFVNISAPGIVGSISAMNLDGVAVGVNMSPGANCDPGNIGVNSLLMTRLCVQHCSSAESAAELIAGLQKGVSWLYIVADGKNSRSFVAEAGVSGPMPDVTQIPPKEFRPFLPDAEYIRRHGSVPYQNGVMFRWNDYKYPAGYLWFNPRLWEQYNKVNNTHKTISEGAFDTVGYINKAGERNCPSTFYFAPQREDSGDILIATNHYIIPEMRYFAMDPWTARVIGKRADDIQWRYDELNRQIHDTISERGSIGFEEMKELISFLAPYGKNKAYYADNPKSGDGKEIRIEGCVSAFDLKNKIMESHYGYYCDKWVRINLPRYF